MAYDQAVRGWGVQRGPLLSSCDAARVLAIHPTPSYDDRPVAIVAMRAPAHRGLGHCAAAMRRRSLPWLIGGLLLMAAPSAAQQRPTPLLQRAARPAETAVSPGRVPEDSLPLSRPTRSGRAGRAAGIGAVVGGVAGLVLGARLAPTSCPDPRGGASCRVGATQAVFALVGGVAGVTVGGLSGALIGAALPAPATGRASPGMLPNVALLLTGPSRTAAKCSLRSLAASC